MSNSKELLESTDIIVNCPAYTTAKLKNSRARLVTKNTPDEFYTLYDNDKLYCDTKFNGLGGIYTIGSVISSSLRDGTDPLEAVARANAHGHKLHFIFGNGTLISNSKKEKAKYIHVELGDIVLFEGVYFTIIKAPNDNLHLEPFFKDEQ